MRIGGAPSGKALLISVAVALFATSGFAATAGSIILSDGTLRRGRFDFLNLGYATLNGNDIDRANIAAIILADIAQPKRDVLVTRDGNLRAGTLGTCNPASCTFDSAVVPRDSTRWIGLAQEGNAPPEPPSEDTPAGAAPVTVTISVTGTLIDTERMKAPVQDTTSANLTITP